MALKPKRIIHDPKAAFVRKIAIHSPSGSGKTHLSGGAQDVPELSDVYFLDCDAGTETLKSRGDIEAEETRRGIDVERVLMAFLNRDADTLKYKCLVLDGLSALLKKEFEESTKDKKDPTFKDYGKNSSLGIRLIHLVRDLPITAIVNVWTRERPGVIPGTDRKDDNAPVRFMPDIPNGALNSFEGAMDDIFYLARGEGKDRFLYTDKVTTTTQVIHAKMRDPSVAAQFTSDFGGKVMPIIKNPTMQQLFDRYQKAYVKS